MTDLPPDIIKKIEGARKAGWPDSVIMKFAAADLASRKSQPTVVSQPKKQNILVESLPLVGGIAGATLGSIFGGVGAIGGGALGSAAGEAVRQKITGEKDTEKIVKEGALGLVGGVAGEAIGAGARLAGKVGGRLLGFGTNKAAQAVLKASPSAYGRAAEAGLDLNQVFIKYAPKIGSSFDEMLGTTARQGGKIQQLIREAEDVIEQTARITGRNVRFSGDEVIDALRKEARVLSNQLGEETRRKALQNIIREAEKKYSRGISVMQARKILREANMKFGKSILETTGDAVARAAQKLEANTIRSLLKETFPDIASALDTEQELIVLREVLKTARNKLATRGFKLGRLDLTRPGTLFDMVFEQPRVATGIVRLGSKSMETPLLSAVASGEKIAPNIGKQIMDRIIRQTIGQVGVRTASRAPEEGGEIGRVSSLEQLIATLPEEKQQAEPVVPRENFMAAMIYDLATTGGKNLTKIKTLYDFMNPQSSVSSTQLQQIAAIKTAEGIVDEFESSVKSLGLKRFGPSARVSGKLRRLWASAGFDPVLREYLAFREAAASRLSRALGEVGNLREEDIQRAIKEVPLPEDTLEEALLKLNRLRNLIANSRRSLETTIGQYKGAAITQEYSIEE